MFHRAASIFKGGAGRTFLRQRASQNVHRQSQQQQRNMGGGRAFMEVSDVHSKLGEAFGFICWLWVFHRARNDLPVVLGWRHPWEHADDPWATSDESQIENIAELQNDWDRFVVKVMKPGDGDDDEDEADDEEEAEDEEETEEEDDD